MHINLVDLQRKYYNMSQSDREKGKDVGRVKHRLLTSKLACKEQTNKMGGFEIRNPLAPEISFNSGKLISFLFFQVFRAVLIFIYFYLFFY